MQIKKENIPNQSYLNNFFQNATPILIFISLLLISLIAIGVRIYSVIFQFQVIRYESYIHEFDPWFNYRTTLYLIKNGIYEMWNWFDPDSWYPLGRIVGSTLYPGLMSTAGFIYHFLKLISFPVDIRNVCVFMAPIFAAFTSIVAYLFTYEISGKTFAGLYSALFIAVVPGYIQRSVAGSYDNEAVSIFALIFTFYLYIKGVNNGSVLYAVFSSLAYFYMVSSWGGYAFITNIIPIFTLYLFLADRLTTSALVTYQTFYVLGTLLAMQLPFVGLQAIHSAEHLASHSVFIFLSVYSLVKFIQKYVSEEQFRYIKTIFIFGIIAMIILVLLYLMISGKAKWTARSLTLLDPNYAKKYIPIVASVSEHQVTDFLNFFRDNHALLIFTPPGLYYCFKKNTDGTMFLAIYCILSLYFASVMIRLILIMAPAFSIASGLGVSFIMEKCVDSFKKINIQNKMSKITITYISSIFFFHSHIMGAEIYSNPSVVIPYTDNNMKSYFDDYREAYQWLNQNTKDEARILSWWDYGYQIAGMSQRSVVTDNNTWNTTHIATVGLAFASDEFEAFEICNNWDIDYVLINFGGYLDFAGDDLNKFYWILRITGDVYPHIKWENYLKDNKFTINKQGSETFHQSLIYKLSFYNFEHQQVGSTTGYDRVRKEFPIKNIKLEHFEEAYTTKNWLVRIFKVKRKQNRDQIEMILGSNQIINPENQNDQLKNKI